MCTVFCSNKYYFISFFKSYRFFLLSMHKLHSGIKISDAEFQFASLKWAECKSVLYLMFIQFEEVMATIKVFYIYLNYQISL